MNARTRHRAAFLEASRRYLFAKEPTVEQLHAFASSFADMVACDRGEPVMVMIGKVPVGRGQIGNR
ncbi:hypothetical protein LMG28688_01572 [Paraburkholderia caffeinitolerans]|uniref:Uncharacterized protein n=1 Tax=Paraburkholderia caffeinitolerans TaxID=1723730 RepID=A0A6J5FQ38_9BURK|nr:hypothetical protein [Paraburkholderia caffeinitolerans]CAB3783070.1 hypothetical protein LMG28688_01572 [Paraburkholderia caffeinitolerans]